MKFNLPKTSWTAMLIVLAILLYPLDQTKAQSQEVQWYEMIQIKFKPGKSQEARKFISNHFLVIDIALGQEGRIQQLEYAYGDWDLVVLFPLGDRDHLSWKTSPSGIEWWETFEELAGGNKQAKELLEQWNAMVFNSKSSLVKRNY